MSSRVAQRLSTIVPNRTFSTFKPRDVVILSSARTPIGGFNGSLASLSGAELGGVASREAIKRAGIKPEDINEVILGNVVSAAAGQAPANQAAKKAGIPDSVPTTGVNKVCASGMKTVMLAAQSIMLGHNDVVLAGGFESMTNIPYYLPKARQGLGLGNGEIVDGLIKDGLWDAFDNHHMGMCAEHCATTYNITRQDQDAYALESYRRAQEATKGGKFASEIVGVEVKNKKGEVQTLVEDEEVFKLNASKVPTLRSAFKKDGTVTAANASKLNDGACSLIISSSQYAESKGIKPIARIIGFADAQLKGIEFTIAPAKAIPRALAMAGKTIADVDFFEINEAFSVVSLANMKLLGIPSEKINVWGGAVALGHPIGMSGARIIGTLANILKERNGKIGVASICNGGGGASAIVIERI